MNGRAAALVRPSGDPPPVIVVEGDRRVYEAAVVEVERAGWRVVRGFGGSVAGRREVRTGAVETESDAAAALLAVLGGAGLIAHGLASREILDRLVDDLRHAGPLEVRSSAGTDPPALDPEAIAILGILAEGRTLGDAARTLALSRRTADRRLAEARRAFGVERTVEAVARARRLGWLG